MKTEALCGAVQHGAPWLEQFRLKTYAGAFRAYREQYGPVYEAALKETGTDEQALSGLAARILDGLEDGWKRERLWNRSAARADCKQMLVNYLSPMLLALDSPESRTLCAMLRDGWTARRPRDAYRVVSYEKIQHGFRNAIMGLEIGKKEPEIKEDL